LREKGEGKKGETFTRITLSTNTLRAKGEEVKAKIEKQRTRVRARKTMKSSRKAQNEHSFSPSQKEERFTNKSTELSRRSPHVLNHCCGVSNNPFCLVFPHNPCKWLFFRLHSPVPRRPDKQQTKRSKQPI